MNNDQLSRLFAHSHWANTHVAMLLNQLPQRVLEADSSRFYTGGAWQALRHIVDVEWSWLRCCQGLDMKAWVWDVFPMNNMQELLDFIAEEYPRVDAYVDALSEADLAQMVNINNATEEPQFVTRGDLLMHIFNHSVEHRGDLAHFLTDHNLSPSDLDYLDWLLAENKGQTPA